MTDPAPISPQALSVLGDQVFVERRARIAAAWAREQRDHFDRLLQSRTDPDGEAGLIPTSRANGGPDAVE